MCLMCRLLFHRGNLPADFGASDGTLRTESRVIRDELNAYPAAVFLRALHRSIDIRDAHPCHLPRLHNGSIATEWFASSR